MATKRAKREPVSIDATPEAARAHYAVMSRGDSTVPAPPPSRTIAPGTRVSFGGLTDVVVEGWERDDGGLLMISATRGKEERRVFMVVLWVDVLPISSDTNVPSFGRVERYGTQYSQQMLRSLLSMSYRRGLLDNPDYQRGYVWTIGDKRRLIGSVLNRFDIGKFVLMEHEWPENRIEVVDGKQRLQALTEFVESRFDYEGRFWHELSWTDRHIFNDLLVQVCMLDASKAKRSDVLWVFLAVNRGGVPQSEEHIAHVRELYEQALIDEGKNRP